VSQSGISIIEYKPEFEKGWLQCRILSFLDSAYYDDIYQNKEIYENPSIELLSIVDDQVIGILDIEYETNPQSVCSRYAGLPSDHLAGMIWHLAVHPEHRRKGVATSLLKKALEIGKSKNLSRLEAWTRDDQFVLDWYSNNNFKHNSSYIHWYFDSNIDNPEILNDLIETKVQGVRIHKLYGIAKEMNSTLQKLNRFHNCNRFDLIINLK
jgi:GNAT superfamily N-acetyltransferase